MLLGGTHMGPNGERTSQPLLSMNQPLLFPMPLHLALYPMAPPWSPILDPMPEDHRRYGPCLDPMMIGTVPSAQLPMYGRVVLTGEAMIPVLLNQPLLSPSQSLLSPMPLHPTFYPMVSPWSPALETLPEKHRSLFITFSRGYPISKDDIMEYFNSRFGPCVESVIIGRAPAGQPPIYGRMVLRSTAMIPVVLNGQPRAKFRIKCRHLWARIYIPN